jgi:hypothetical protein
MNIRAGLQACIHCQYHFSCLRNDAVYNLCYIFALRPLYVQVSA